MSTIDRLRELERAATEGPWRWLDGNGDDDDEIQDGRGEMVATGFRDDLLPDITDGRLCAAARNALPALLDVAEAARALCRINEGDTMCCEQSIHTRGADHHNCQWHDLAAALARLEAIEP